MKTIGLIGGMSWESTIPYYRIINQTVKQKLGGFHSAKVVLVSVDFHEIEALQRAGDWDGAADILVDAARSLQAAGADFLVICTNTMHKVSKAIEDAVALPLFHIADPTAQEIKRQDIQKIGLLGTRFTMEQDFDKQRLQVQHGLEVVVPNSEDMDIIHRIIYQELCLGKIEDASRQEYRRIMQKLVEQGAQGIILGCTEISLLVSAADASVPLFDTTGLHASKAAEFALGL
ncbi:MAG: aspartate/glutamate racemase family protein [Burkholderiaceae bacterium]|nr:MAG: aspartate/glutamate racemase family protein [Burkholderiaceae bacterium]